MRWHWYVARNDELMIDLDSRTLLELALKRLEKVNFEYHSIFAALSQNPEHFHLAVKLKKEMPVLERMIWQLFLMDHVYRSVKNLFRVLDKIPAPSLLIAPKPWPLFEKPSDVFTERRAGHRIPGPFFYLFWRQPDAICRCQLQRHKDREGIKTCPAHILLRGKEST